MTSYTPEVDVELWDMRRTLEAAPFRSKAALYSHIRRGDFPSPVRLGARVFWVAEEVRACLRNALADAINARDDEQTVE